MLELFIMAVSFNPLIPLIVMLKTTQQIYFTLMITKDQQQVPKTFFVLYFCYLLEHSDNLTL